MYLIVLILLCSNMNIFDVSAQIQSQKKPQFTANEILKTFNTYYDYEFRYINLNDEYIAYNTSGIQISKKHFLKMLASGKFLPLILRSKGVVAYQLYSLPQNINPDINSRLKQLGSQYNKYYEMEGKPLPSFHYVDLNGRRYDENTTRGKIIVLKCWFIHCQVCIEEIPQLNKLVNKYKNRKDILFISLAFDSDEELRSFLKKTEFGYAIIPNKKQYLLKELKIDSYPTHLIIGRDGKISKVIDAANQLISALNREAEK